MKKTVVLAMMLLAILFVGVIPVLAAEDDGPDLARLTVVNNTDGKVFLQLNATNAHFLTIGAGSTAEFTVEKEEYVRQTWACGAYAKGSLDMSSQVKLVFTPCGVAAPNAGEPTMEKIDMAELTGGLDWRYQDVE
jgi:hypothetical protein